MREGACRFPDLADKFALLTEAIRFTARSLLRAEVTGDGLLGE
jgi:hypothetical protein